MGVQTQEIDVPTFMDYRAISDDLIERIRSGEYAPGQKLPSYAELAGIYSVGVSTVSRAYARLQDLGWAYGVHGRGVYVADKPPGQ